MAITQSSRNLAINTPLGEDKVLILHASITEELGRLFQMDVELASDDPNLDFSAIVGGNATIRLELLTSKTPRYFNGFISRFVQTGATGDSGTYRATLVPWLWFLTRTSDCRIFQKLAVPDIIKQVFRDHGFTDFKDSLSGSYTPWEYCVQYRETDFNFVSRLMEHEGIYYFFEHENGKHTLVLADSSSAHSSFPNYDEVPYRNARTKLNVETIASWTLEQEVQPGTYALNDFNFEKPKTSLVAQSEIPTDNAQSNFVIYDYPGEYGEQSEGSDYAKVRIEELHSQYEVVHGDGNARGLAVGSTFSLTASPRRDQNRKYLITSASYHLSADNYLGGSEARSDAETFTCSFAAIDASKPFRSARVTPKPLIQGPQTAIVVGPAGEEIYTDTYGRIKLQFHWDRYGKANEDASCWVRISQSAWAGKHYGAIYIPRVGQEVIVEFLEGDPDLPIVTGRVYNADCMPPYDLPANKTMTTLKSNSSKGSGGFNELRFEDKKGEEQVFIHGEKNLDVRIKNDAFEWIGHDQNLVVKNSLIEHVELDHSETIDRDHKELVKRDFNSTITGKVAQSVGGSLSLQVTGDVAEVFQGNHSEGVTQNYYVKADNIVIEAMTNVTIKVGGSYIAIEAGGITIGTTGTLELQASGPLSAKSDAQAQVEAPQTSVKGDAMVTIQGGIVQIN
jgi:type VI secretion system secreted protein VgrG